MSHLTEQQLERIVARTRTEREAQGLPPAVQDPATLAKVARLVAGADRAADRVSSSRRPAPVVGEQGTSSKAAS